MSTFEELWAAAGRAAEVNDLPALIQCLEAVIEVEPEHPGAWRELGIARQKSGELQEARKAFEMALELDADNEHRLAMQFALGAVLLDLDEPGEALYVYQEILDEEGENPEAFLQGGICFCRLGQWEDGLDCITTALAHGGAGPKPDRGAEPGLMQTAQVWRALCLAHLDRSDELMEVLEILAREFHDGQVGEDLIQGLDPGTSASLIERVRQRLPALRALADGAPRG